MEPIVITSENFENEVLKSQEPILIDFWASWCGPCKMLSPLVDKIAEEGVIKVGKINVDDEMELAGEYGVASIPTLLIFKNGEVAAQSIGFKPMPALKAWVASVK
ncbi:MAG: thioredoxin [Firmicutes bacterium]|nr:thioredoxin [Bacillota bacterium]